MFYGNVRVVCTVAKRIVCALRSFIVLYERTGHESSIDKIIVYTLVIAIECVLKVVTPRNGRNSQKTPGQTVIFFSPKTTEKRRGEKFLFSFLTKKFLFFFLILFSELSLFISKVE